MVPCKARWTNLDVILQWSQVKLVADGERKEVMAVCISDFTTSPKAVPYLMSMDSFCSLSFDPLVVRQSYLNARRHIVDIWDSYQYWALPLSLWYVLPCIVRYARTLELIDAVDSAGPSSP